MCIRDSPHSSLACVSTPPVRVAVATVLRRSAVVFFSSLCYFRMKNSAPFSTRWKHLPTFGAASRHRANVMPNTLRCFLEVLHPVLLFSPGVALTPEHRPEQYPPPHALFHQACHKACEKYPSSASRHLNAVGIFPGKRVGIGQVTVFGLSSPPAEVSEDQLLVDLRSLSEPAVRVLPYVTHLSSSRRAASAPCGSSAHSNGIRFPSCTAYTTAVPSGSHALPRHF